MPNRVGAHDHPEEFRGTDCDVHVATHAGSVPCPAFATLQRHRIMRVISHDAVGVRDLAPGDYFPDLELSDTDGNLRRLSELAGPDPLLLHTYRGWFCPKERAFLRQLVALQDEAEVAYTRVVSVEAPATAAAFRAGLGARWTFLCDEHRTGLELTGLQEVTDTVHHPYLPTVWLLSPDLAVHRWWLGYWYWGRPGVEELRRELCRLTRGLRTDWAPPRPEVDS